MRLRYQPLVLAIALSLPLDVLSHVPGDGTAVGDDTGGFDLQQLEKSGYSADIARFFAREARFMPGTHTVGVSINAGLRREVSLRFDGQGTPCFDPILLSQLGLKAGLQEAGQACRELASLFPGSRSELRPGSMQVDLTVPRDAFARTKNDDLQRGGSAAMLNYDLFAQQFQSRSATSGAFSARVEGGVNVASWALRSRGDYSHRNDVSRYVQQETYAQRPLEALSAVLQVGELSAMSDGSGGFPIWGVQLHSDSAQVRTHALAVPIQGMADTNATVEIRQRGDVVYRTIVAPGPYSIEDVGDVRRGTDIEVVVTEEDGRQSRSVVPAPMTPVDAPLPATFHLGLGRYRPRSGQALAGNAPWLAYGDHGVDAFGNARITSSVLVATGYQGIGTQASFSVGDAAWLGVGGRLSHAADHGIGTELQAQGNAQLGAGFSGGLSWQMRDSRFTSLDDTLALRDADPSSPPFELPFQQSFSGSLSWSNPRWGAFSYGMAHSRNDGDTAFSHSFSASRRFGSIAASLNVQKAQDRGYSAFLNVQVPLGSNSMSARVYRYANGSQSAGASYQGKLDQDRSYQMDVSRSATTQRIGGSVRALTAYGAFGAGVTQTSGESRTAYGTASGGLALVRGGGFAMSNSRISDTFALVKVPTVAGIRMSGSSTARTSWRGTALLPSVTPYRTSRVQLDGRTLPLNYRFATTTLDLKLARGAVSAHVIPATEIRQLMLNVTLSDGSVARLGSPLYDVEGEFIGTVVGEGNVILDNEQIGQPVFLEQAGTRCEVRYTAPAQFDAERPYEEADGLCA